MFYVFQPDWTPGGPLDQCDRKLSTKWHRALHIMIEKPTKPQLYLHKIEKLNATNPDWPFALVRLGRAYLFLEDLHGALEQFEKAQSLLLPLQDERFSQYVEGLRAYIKDLETEEDDEWARPFNGAIVSHWTPPKNIRQYQFSDAWGASTIKSVWENLLSEDKTGIISRRYARLSCIGSNELEKVFALGGQSLLRLVKVGFYTGAIDCVKAEGVQEPQNIIAILEDLQECLDFLTTIAKNPSELSEDIICHMHKIIMKSSRIRSHYNGEDTLFYLARPGVYRKRLIITRLTAKNIVQHTHRSMVPSEMNLFVNMMRKCLEEKDVSPFAMAAWIHATFMRIQPFIHGNGRVSRLLASLPLIRAGYPPINVCRHEEYLQGEFKAQTASDLQPLADALASSMFDSINYIRSLPLTSSEDKQYRISADVGTTQLYL